MVYWFGGIVHGILEVSSERWVISMNDKLVKQLTNIINNFDKGYINEIDVTQEVIDAYMQYTTARNEIYSEQF